ncbi:MAG: ribosomal protein S18-alanine N-acetyltransferase [Xanthomonadales bacterium]|nr:ribosomal protein S18-alanine N-acetyltransferase [Xanthomonadales bacterium]
MGETRPFAQIQLRAGTLADLNSLLALEVAVFSGDRLSRRQLRHHLRADSSDLLVASGAGALLGYALLLHRRGSSMGRIYSIAVSAQARGLGLGSRLLEAIESTAAERGLRRMQLEVRADNEAAIKLYLRHGYLRYAQRPGYYEDGAEALCMRKAIGPRV